MDEAYINSFLVKLPFEIPEQLATKILVYLEMLVKWNKAYNLTAIRSKEQMLTHHFLDSLVQLLLKTQR